jgi:hypothetical protein
MEKIIHTTRKGNDTNYDVGNPGPDLGQAQKYGRVKPIGTNYYHLQQK